MNLHPQNQMEWNEDTLEQFIKDNKDKFNKYDPSVNHNEHFILKLAKRFKRIISIIPHLVKVGIATVLIFVASFFVWHNFICPPLTRISIKKYWKIEHVYRYEICRAEKTLNDSDKIEIKSLDLSYKFIKKELRKNPTQENIDNMLNFYREKLFMIKQYK